MKRSHWLRPRDVLVQLGIERPEDIVIEEIAQHFGATILYERLHGCEARIVGHGDRAIITVNASVSRGRQRFSGGHELGHWMRDRGTAAFACTESMLASEWGTGSPETRANKYAAELLLPERFFKPDANNRPITFATVRELAARYRTSLTATALRLVILGSFPSMVVCCQPGQRWKWFKRSPDLPSCVWPRDTPGAETLAHAILLGEESSDGPEDVSAAGWFEMPGAERYAIKESVIRVPDGALALLWWEDESQLLHL